MTDLRATVLGAGSVGLGVSASLAFAGFRVTLLTRSESVDALRDATITVDGMLGEHALPPRAIAVENAAFPSALAIACDMLIVTTKTHDIAAALAPVSATGLRPGAVLSMQNGLGASETIRSTLGSSVPVFASAMMIGFERQGLSHVTIKAAASPVMTGSLLDDPPQTLQTFVAASQDGFLPICVDPAIREMVLFKLLFNTCMNPTGALTGMTYGALVTHPQTKRLIERLSDETLRVLAAAYDYRPSVSGPAYVQETLAPAVLARSSGHRSSMLQDIERGRRTEIDCLNGEVARLGGTYGIPTPTHDALIDLVAAHHPSG